MIYYLLFVLMIFDVWGTPAASLRCWCGWARRKGYVYVYVYISIIIIIIIIIIQVDGGQSSKDAVALMKAFLARAEETELLAALPENVWADFQSGIYDDAITFFTRVW